MRGFVEPPENELRRMLEARERSQEIARQGLWKRGSKVMLIGFVVLLAVALAFPQVRDLIATTARELPKEMGEPKAAAAPAAKPSDEDLLKKAAGMVSKANGGKAVDTKDLEFGVELLQFMQGPPKKEEEKGKATAK